jgi:hypothetical protein
MVTMSQKSSLLQPANSVSQALIPDSLRRAVSDLTLDKLILTEAANEGLLSPELRRACVENVKAELGVSERRACRVLGQHRSTQRKRPRSRGGAGHDSGHRQHSAVRHC